MKRTRTIETVTPAPKLRRQGRSKFSSRTKAAARAFPLTRNVGSYRTGFPKQMFMRHKYLQNFTLTGTTGALATFQLSVNGMFDPDNAGATTHQPMYFDTMTALYNKFTVLASKCTFTVTPTACAGSMLLGAYVEDDATVTPTTAVACAEQASARFRFFGPANTTTIGQTSFNQANQLSLRWTSKKAFGGDTLDNPNLQGTASANPTEQQFYTIFLQDGVATPANTVTLNVNAVIEYSAQWLELKNPDGM